MENVRTLNTKLETLAWAAFFIWWGITELFQALPPGIGAVGIGVILLGLNAARRVYFCGVPVVDAETRRSYLERAYKLGKEFAQS